MTRILLVGQETGGVGKSTVVRGLAEAVPDAALVEIESVHRLQEFKRAKAGIEAGKVRFFEMRASRESIDETGGQAARAELDPMIDALYGVSVPAIVDIGANTAGTVFAALADHAEGLREAGVELGAVLVVSSEPGSLADASKLLKLSHAWTDTAFFVANEVRAPLDGDVLAKVAAGAPVETLRRFEFEPATASVLQAAQLRGIEQLNRDALRAQHGPSRAARIVKDLAGYRLAVMQAVKPAALWLVNHERARAA